MVVGIAWPVRERVYISSLSSSARVIPGRLVHSFARLAAGLRESPGSYIDDPRASLIKRPRWTFTLPSLRAFQPALIENLLRRVKSRYKIFYLTINTLSQLFQYLINYFSFLS